MSRKPDLPCADCGKLMWRRPGQSLPAGVARCHDCRRLRPASAYPSKRLVCEWCGEEVLRFRVRQTTRYCSLECFARADGARRRAEHAHAPTSKDSRAAREAAAPGLSKRQREKLLARWKRRGAVCAYCPDVADTIDHVVPLILGGTNFEGNLVPACRRCNSSKSSRLIVEWRRAA